MCKNNYNKRQNCKMDTTWNEYYSIPPYSSKPSKHIVDYDELSKDNDLIEKAKLPISKMLELSAKFGL